MAKVALIMNIWLKYFLQLNKSWVRKGQLSKSSKELWRINFCSGSKHFYMVCAQQILFDCCIRNCSGGKKNVFWFYGKSPLYQILDTKSLLLKDIIRKNNPQTQHTENIDPDIQHQECYSDPAHRGFFFPIMLHFCWQGGSVHQLQKGCWSAHWEDMPSMIYPTISVYRATGTVGRLWIWYLLLGLKPLLLKTIQLFTKKCHEEVE